MEPTDTKNQKKAFYLYLFFTSILTSNMYVQQQLFKAAPQVATMQWTFARGALCLLLLLLYVNREIRAKFWTPVTCQSLPSLAFRSIQGALSVYIGFSSLKLFPVSTVGIIGTLKPLIVLVFDRLIFGASLTFRKISINSLLFIAVCLVILGVQAGTASSESAISE